jgi:hypothetical protein
MRSRTIERGEGSDPRDALAREVEALRRLQALLTGGDRARLQGEVRRALEVGACPRCAETQADGAPCASPSTACDDCVRALDWIRDLRVEIERALRA